MWQDFAAQMGNGCKEKPYAISACPNRLDLVNWKEGLILSMMPFVLMGRKKLPPESAPSDEQLYDVHLQLWIDKKSGMPLVSLMRANAQPTRFGETTMTETREGVDQTEGATFQASQFGETIITKTHEGADQSERTASFQASQFGETTHTRTREGVDQTEGTALQASQFGETTLTNTVEGADKTEGVAPLAFNAPHSHF
jgi:hypothetical protein